MTLSSFDIVVKIITFNLMNAPVSLILVPGKFGAVVASIPIPVAAALYCVLFAYVGMYHITMIIVDDGPCGSRSTDNTVHIFKMF